MQIIFACNLDEQCQVNDEKGREKAKFIGTYVKCFWVEAGGKGCEIDDRDHFRCRSI